MSKRNRNEIVITLALTAEDRLVVDQELLVGLKLIEADEKAFMEEAERKMKEWKYQEICQIFGITPTEG